MKTSFILYATLVFCLWSCAKEKDFPTDYAYPYLELVQAVADSTGIKVRAEIIKQGSASVKEYGFIYYQSNKPQQKVMVKTPLVNNSFSFHLKDRLLKGAVYQVSAYAVVGIKTIHTPISKIESIISSQPVITDFSP